LQNKSVLAHAISVPSTALQLTTGEAVLQFDVVQQSTLSPESHVSSHDFTRVPDVKSVFD
jgi:hypothetical protein